MADLAELQKVITNLRFTGTDYRGDCPVCGTPGGFRLEIHSAQRTETASPCGCRVDIVKDAVRALLKSRNGVEPTNGAEPTEHRGFVVNVVPSSAKRNNEPPSELEPEAYYGLPGEVVATIEPHTESHPAAILASFLIGAGCLIGPKPYVYRDGARHYCNEFANLVGRTAKGRKGTATRRVEEIFRSIFNSNSTELTTCRSLPVSYADLLMTGLGSGEALIEELADPDSDRRRLVFEEEFSKPLKVMRREGSTLSETLRSAWDGGVLANRTKGKKLQAVGAHVCVLGHITEEEMKLQIGSTEMFNGFANRFLWFMTQRSKSLPFGGGKAPLGPVVSRFYKTLQYAWTIGEVEFDADTKRVWAEGGVYDRLTERPAGMLGAVTSRAEAHVTRLALTYSVLDAERVIRLPHILAALAVWDYSERTCRYLFGTSLGDEYADSLDEKLIEVYPGGLSRTQIRDSFGRNAPPQRIPRALNLLSDLGRAECRKYPGEDGGRPAEVWFSTAFDARQNDINDKTPLQLARQRVAEWGMAE